MYVVHSLEIINVSSGTSPTALMEFQILYLSNGNLVLKL
jgi:hypothetical protein